MIVLVFLTFLAAMLTIGIAMGRCQERLGRIRRAAQRREDRGEWEHLWFRAGWDADRFIDLVLCRESRWAWGRIEEWRGTADDPGVWAGHKIACVNRLVMIPGCPVCAEDHGFDARLREVVREPPWEPSVAPERRN